MCKIFSEVVDDPTKTSRPISLCNLSCETEQSVQEAHRKGGERRYIFSFGRHFRFVSLLFGDKKTRK